MPVHSPADRSHAEVGVAGAVVAPRERGGAAEGCGPEFTVAQGEFPREPFA